MRLLLASQYALVCLMYNDEIIENGKLWCDCGADLFSLFFLFSLFSVTLVSPTPLAIYDASATPPYLACINTSFWTFFCKF